MGTIALIGYGYVGRAIHAHLKGRENIEIVDPALSTRTVCDVNGLTGAIICVPTPENSDGSCDASIVEAVIADLPEDCHVLVKSTLSLTAWERLRSRRKLLCYSPEFLRAATAASDVANADRVILAGEGRQFWLEHYARHFEQAQVVYASPREAIAAKYAVNAFLACKVTFFNQFYDFCRGAGIDFEMARALAAGDSRIGSSHSGLNETGTKGWGGACFPKDTAALLHMAKERGVEMPLLASAVEYNREQVK